VGAFERDLEKTLGPADQARYENARWWRILNRYMAVIGIGVIIAVVSLTLSVISLSRSSG
jgi:adenylylsulfate kinase-like enzyme